MRSFRLSSSSHPSGMSRSMILRGTPRLRMGGVTPSPNVWNRRKLVLSRQTEVQKLCKVRLEIPSRRQEFLNALCTLPQWVCERTIAISLDTGEQQDLLLHRSTADHL